MTTSDTMARLRLADGGLRRYATRMVGRAVEGVLHDAYVSTVLWTEPIWDGSHASIPLLRRVHNESAAVARFRNDHTSADELESALRSLPSVQRGALLLTMLENLRADEASQVLDVPVSSVLDYADSAADVIRQHVPALVSADSVQLGRALADLPVRPASPQFWDRLAADLGAGNTTTLDPIDDATIANSGLTGLVPSPPREPKWPAILAGFGAISVVALIVVFLVTRSPGEEVVAQSVDVTLPTTSAPVIDDQTSSQPFADPPATSAPTTTPPTTAPPTTTSLTTAPPTTLAPTSASPSTLGTTTVATPTPAPPAPDDANDRGAVSFQDDLARIDGSLAPGTSDAWRLDVESGQTLSIVVDGLRGVAVSVHRSDGSTVAAEYADGGLQVITEPGSHFLRLTDSAGSGADYSVGIGRTPPRSGFLANRDELGVAFSALELTSCTSNGDQLDASFVTAGAVVMVAFRLGTDPDTVTWLGAEEVAGAITAANSVSTGLVLTGSIVVGRGPLVGLPFWLGVYGCSETS